jgi:hypothetical protein
MKDKMNIAQLDDYCLTKIFTFCCEKKENLQSISLTCKKFNEINKKDNILKILIKTSLKEKFNYDKLFNKVSIIYHKKIDMFNSNTEKSIIDSIRDDNISCLKFLNQQNLELHYLHMLIAIHEEKFKCFQFLFLIGIMPTVEMCNYNPNVLLLFYNMGFSIDKPAAQNIIRFNSNSEKCLDFIKILYMLRFDAEFLLDVYSQTHNLNLKILEFFHQIQTKFSTQVIENLIKKSIYIKFLVEKQYTLPNNICDIVASYTTVDIIELLHQKGFPVTSTTFYNALYNQPVFEYLYRIKCPMTPRVYDRILMEYQDEINLIHNIQILTSIRCDVDEKVLEQIMDLREKMTPETHSSIIGLVIMMKIHIVK